MNKRQQQKEDSRRKILDTASRQLRKDGIGGISIGSVMKDAGLTHGAFYAHFANKSTLAQQAFDHAINGNVPAWVSPTDETWQARIERLSDEYLTPHHRDHPESGCAIAAMASEVGITDPDFQANYASTVETTLSNIAEDNPDHLDDAIALLAMCTGAINLARNLQDETLSDRVLASCRQAVRRFVHS